MLSRHFHHTIGRRYQSIASVLSRLQSSQSVTRDEIRHAFQNEAPSDDHLKSLHQVLQSAPEQNLVNEILRHGLPHDFSLYFTVSRALADHQWDSNSLLALVENNPGRAFSLEHLIQKHGQNSVSREIKKALATKLLLGERSEEGDYRPSLEHIEKALALVADSDDVAAINKLLPVILEHMVESGATSLLDLVEIPGLNEWLQGQLLEASGDKFSVLMRCLYGKCPEELPKLQVAKWLRHLGKGLNLELLAEVVAHTENQKLDKDPIDAELLLLRIQLMESIGIDLGDVEKALRVFHDYQSHHKFGIEFVQAALVKVFCYQGFKENNPTSLKVAETLLNPEGLAVSTVAQIILAHGRFSSEQSLEVYNKYIRNVSKAINEQTGRSPTGVLTEAMMVASLYDNDREFAQLLFEKARANDIISNEHEVAQMKKVFKVFGDAFVEDSWAVAQPIFGDYVLKCIKG